MEGNGESESVCDESAGAHRFAAAHRKNCDLNAACKFAVGLELVGCRGLHLARLAATRLFGASSIRAGAVAASTAGAFGVSQ